MKSLFNVRKVFMALMPFAMLFALAGCQKSDYIMLDPKGTVSAGQLDMILFTTKLILIIIIPVLIMLVAFAWKYRASNTSAKYLPEWAHNNTMEVVWWTIPIIIILILATATYKSSHEFDPKKSVAKAGEKELRIQAVSLNWKWMFLYPEQKIATINTVAIPQDVPVVFQLTADGPMNSFLVPNLSGQNYAMAGMTTHLNIRGTELGEYQTVGAVYTGGEYAKNRFKTKVISAADFEQWVQEAQTGNALTVERYNALVKDSLEEPTLFSSYPENLYGMILDKYIKPMKGVNISEDGKKAYDPIPGGNLTGPELQPASASGSETKAPGNSGGHGGHGGH